MTATSQTPMVITLDKNRALPGHFVRQYETATSIRATETAPIISLLFLFMKGAQQALHRLDIPPFALLTRPREEALSDDIQGAHRRHSCDCNSDTCSKSRAPGAGSVSQAHRHGRVPVAAPHRPADFPLWKENRLRAPLRRSDD